MFNAAWQIFALSLIVAGLAVVVWDGHNRQMEASVEASDGSEAQQAATGDGAEVLELRAGGNTAQ